jgi:glycosyltransferase involved in cell wall biosynthesis
MGGPHLTAPFVSVVVAIYNAEQTLADCIDSLLRLDYPADRVEIICVDNASTDRTGAILGRYAERVRILHEPKRGAAAARNTGVRHARGEHIAFTDADCVVDPGWLRANTAPLEDVAIGAVGGAIRARRPCNSIEVFGEQIHDHAKAIQQYRPPYVITMNWASPTAVLKSVGLFNEELLRSQDVDLSYRILQAGYRFAYAPDAVVYHRNERTLWGLFLEGYVHGYHAHRVLDLHADFLASRRRSEAPLRRSIKRLRHAPALAGADAAWRPRAYAVVFTLGKVVGELYGAMRIAAREAPASETMG